jgi:hypothetical protein
VEIRRDFGTIGEGIVVMLGDESGQRSRLGGEGTA